MAIILNSQNIIGGINSCKMTCTRYVAGIVNNENNIKL